jgi:hypothetical protein
MTSHPFQHNARLSPLISMMRIRLLPRNWTHFLTSMKKRYHLITFKRCWTLKGPVSSPSKMDLNLKRVLGSSGVSNYAVVSLIPVVLLSVLS